MLFTAAGGEVVDDRFAPILCSKAKICPMSFQASHIREPIEQKPSSASRSIRQQTRIDTHILYYISRQSRVYFSRVSVINMSVDLSYKGHVAVVTIRNAERLGALTGDMIAQLGHHMREADDREGKSK